MSPLLTVLTVVSLLIAAGQLLDEHAAAEATHRTAEELAPYVEMHRSALDAPRCPKANVDGSPLKHELWTASDGKDGMLQCTYTERPIE